MKFLLVTLLPVFGLFTASLASPVAEDVAVVKRADYTPEANILSGLISSVKAQTGAINATLAALPANPDAATKSAASAKVNAAVKQITSLINGATAQVKALPAGGATKAKRQGIDVGAIAAQIAALLLELSGTLNGVIAALGLAGLLAFLQPLTTGLSGLILALEVVVDGLLLAVTLLLDTILTGLSVALAGLQL